jgi:hypothetical protein
MVGRENCHRSGTAERHGRPPDISAATHIVTEAVAPGHRLAQEVGLQGSAPVEGDGQRGVQPEPSLGFGERVQSSVQERLGRVSRAGDKLLREHPFGWLDVRDGIRNWMVTAA